MVVSTVFMSNVVNKSYINIMKNIIRRLQIEKSKGHRVKAFTKFEIRLARKFLRNNNKTFDGWRY